MQTRKGKNANKRQAAKENTLQKYNKTLTKDIHYEKKVLYFVKKHNGKKTDTISKKIKIRQS